jgi:hypothetical protein
MISSELQACDSDPLEVRTIDPLADDTWDALVTACEDHTIFHRSAWARVLAESYGHQPHYLEISCSGNPVALIPLMEVTSWITGRRGVSLPFSDFAGPLWMEPQQSRQVYRAITELAAKQKWKHFEIRGDRSGSNEFPHFRTYHSHCLDLTPGIETITRNLDASVRRAIRKAETSGVQTNVGNSPEAIHRFYQLHSRTRRRHGLPPQPASFFNSIARNLLEKDLGTIILAELGGTAVAGAVFFRSGNRAIYKFGASDPEHWPTRPNHAVMWMAIRILIESGCTELQFGRTAPEDQGLLRFKHSWGSKSEPIFYFRHDCRNCVWLPAGPQPAESHPLIFGHLPIVCNRIAGQLIYPHLD